MTPVGYFFLPLVLLCSFTKPERLLSLLVLASVFEASSVFNSAIETFQLGVPPFYVVEVFIAFQLISLAVRKGSLLPDHGDPRRKYLIPLLFFWAWACASAFILPHVFSGMPVYEPRGGIDEQYEALTPLRWSFSNLAQVFYLTLNVGTLIYALHVVRTRRQVSTLLKTLGIALSIAVVAGGVQRIAIFQGWSFPYELLNNNPGYSQGTGQSIGEGIQRINSTFTEASFAGSFLAAMAIGLIAAFLRGRRTMLWLFAALASFLVLLDTTAMNGYVAFALVLGWLFVYFSPFRGPKSARRFLAKGWLVLVVPLLALAGLVVVLFPSFTSAAFTVTTEKSDTLSFLHRLYSDLTALDIFLNTWGIGVGLGSNRPSSMLMAFLSTVGIVGTILFAFFVIRLVRAFPGKSAPGTMQWTFWSLIGLLLAQVVAVPDINRPVLWALIVLVTVPLDIPFRRRSPGPLRFAVRTMTPPGPGPPMSRGATLSANQETTG
jgi:hypothetical protein